MLVPYLRIAVNQDLSNSKECKEFMEAPVLTFVGWDLERQATFLIHQLTLIKYLKMASSNFLNKSVKEYETFLLACNRNFGFKTSAHGTDLEKVIMAKAANIINFLTDRVKDTNLISRQDINFFMRESDSKGRFYKIDKAFGVAYLTHMKIINDKVNLTPDTITDDDYTVFPACSAPVMSIVGKMINVSYVRFPSYKFDPSMVKENIPLLNNVFGFLMCCDWTNKKFLSVLAYLAEFTMERNEHLFKGIVPVSMYYHIQRILFGIKPNITSVTTNDYPRNFWFKDNFVRFLTILRVTYNIKFDAPQILGRILSGDGDSPEQPGLVKYLMNKEEHPEESSVEDYNAFVDSAFYFEELDIKKKATVSSEADEDTTDDTGDNSDTSGDDSTDDPADTSADDTADDAADDTADDTNTDDGSDDGTEPPSDADNTEDEPEPNIDTSDKTGITFELSEDETLDSVIYRREVSLYIKHLLLEKNLDSDKLEILKKLQKYWLNLLSVKTIQDIIKNVKKIK